MAKLTLSNVTNISGAESVALGVINANSDAIETALENTISRDGTSPNSMGADLDMDNNDILNVDNLDVNTLTIDGVPVELLELASAETLAARDEAVAAAAEAELSALEAASLTELHVTQSAVTASPSYTFGSGGFAQIDATLLASWVFDGANGFCNKIGINNTKPVTGTWNNDTGYVAGAASSSAVMGGYDNIANGLASIIASQHSMIYSAATHGTIIGGSVNGIEEGDYCGVFGGTNNRITALRNDGVTASAASFSVISGGTQCRVTNANSGIFSAQAGIADGQYCTIIGGNANKALGNFDHVAGSNNESRVGTGLLGQKNTIGGGRFNIIDSVTNPVSNTISGGEDHEVYGSYNVVGGGDNHTIGQVATNSSYGVIGGGLDNTLTTLTAGTISGGRGHTVSGEYAAVVGGRDNTATASHSTAMGQNAAARYTGGVTHAAGAFAVTGDAQSSRIVLRTTTTNATLTSLTTQAMPDDTTWLFEAKIVARRTDANDESAGYVITGVIDRNSGVGTTALVGAITKTVVGEDTAAWDVTAIANVGSGGLTIQVTGEAAKTIQWVVMLELVEVTG